MLLLTNLATHLVIKFLTNKRLLLRALGTRSVKFTHTNKLAFLAFHNDVDRAIFQHVAQNLIEDSKLLKFETVIDRQDLQAFFEGIVDQIQSLN